MRKRGMTLIEVLVALALAGIMFLAIFHVSTIAGKQVHVYIERYNGYSQIGYALDDMSLRLPSASEIKTPFTEAGVLEIKQAMRFRGASNPYDVTPYQGDTIYRYGIREDGALVLEDQTRGKTEVLIESKFRPHVEFIRHGEQHDAEPDFMTVVISVNCTKSRSIGLPEKLVKAEGIRFWFVDVVQPK
ncbi:MAG: prepilin-type N-terminal cleavage/methylation domain-containing protein [Candidatus Omnitrophica bacterium]|nr:prepilin-type N-terminal cleavage/methylation domain-containing protein [Candidatus Omnitrophota bacterium]MDD5774313.1 prepilin-type N-terminal cleavage/methylation domain-containing protein [Candidatus Omnitrophota bacterium]